MFLHGRSRANRGWSEASVQEDQGSQSASRFPLLPFGVIRCRRYSGAPEIGYTGTRWYDNKQYNLTPARSVRSIEQKHIQGIDKVSPITIHWETQTQFLLSFQRASDKSFYWVSRRCTSCRVSPFHRSWFPGIQHFELSEDSVPLIPESTNCQIIRNRSLLSSVS